MKAIFLLPLICSLHLHTWAQDSTSKKVYESHKEADSKIKDGKYTTSIGWVIKDGNEIKLGKGSMPDKTFAFITEVPGLFTENPGDHFNHKLQHTYNGKNATIAKLYVAGNKKTGFYITATIKVGQLSRYMVDIENSIESGEIEVPAEYAKGGKKDQPVAAPAASLGDELKKLKDLYDSGALTKDEYETAKKKLLNQ